MTISSRPHIAQSLQVIKHDDNRAELRVISDDEAASLLWAAQRLDEHREYTVIGIQLEFGDYSAEDSEGKTTLVVTLDLANEACPGRLGPWAHGVPPVPV